MKLLLQKRGNMFQSSINKRRVTLNHFLKKQKSITKTRNSNHDLLRDCLVKNKFTSKSRQEWTSFQNICLDG